MTSRINRDGYLVYKDRLKIEAAGDLKAVKLPLQPMEREMVIAPNYDIAPPELKPDKAYLKNLAEATREIIPVTEGLKVKPGPYWITVEKANYHPFGKKIFIEPATTPYHVKAHLISVSKVILLKIRSDFDVEPSVNPTK